ncbi:MAG: hypothetical protein V4714_01965 [Bacteroidota bacterium]
MKKQVIIVLLALLTFGECTQEKPNNSGKKPTAPDAILSSATTASALEEDACEAGTQKAKADEAKGIIGYYFWGIATPPFARVLKEKYGFVIHSKGCVMNETEGKEWSCYNAYMDEVIKKKYQQDIIGLESKKSHLEDSARVKAKKEEITKK